MHWPSIRIGARLLAAFVLSLGLEVGALAAADKAAVFYEDALKRYERNDLEAAIIQLKNAIKENQRLLAAHLLLGKALMRSHDFNSAEAAFQAALNQGVNMSEVAVPLGRIYIALGQPEKALERIPASGFPRGVQIEVLAMRGTAYSEAGNPRRAAQSFEEARAVDPNSPTSYIEEVPTLLQAGLKDRARASAAKAIQLAPNSAAAWNMQASVLHDALDMNAALAAYNRAISFDENFVDARIARAAVLLDLKRDAEVEKDLNFLVDAAPQEPRAAYLRAMLATRKGDASSAAKYLGEAARVTDSFPPAWLNRREQLLMLAALAHHGLGNFQKSREYLEIILNRNPTNNTARRLLASIHVQSRDYSRAMPLLESLQKSAPDDPQVLFQIGSVYMGQRRYLLAIASLERAAKRMDTPEVNRALAFCQLGLGRDDKAQAILEKMFAANPADVEAGTTVATLHMRRGERQKALRIAEAMLKQTPANPAALNFLGTIKASSNDNAGARAAFGQALARSPDYRPAILNLVKLDVSEGRLDAGRQRLTALLAKRSDDVDTLYELGLLEQRAGRIEEATRHLTKAVDARSNDTRPGLALVDLQIRERRAEAAAATAKGLASRYPNNLGVQLALGRSFLAMGDMSSARSVFSGATRAAEFEPDLQVLIGRLQLEAGNLQGAAYNIQKAQQGDADHLGAMVLAVDVEAQRKDLAKADAALRALAAKYPNRVETSLTTASLAMFRAQYPAAIAAYRSALAREESTAIALNLAHAYIAAGEAAKAAAFLEGWVKTRPSDQAAIKALAEAQFRAGQLNPARLNYTKALAAEPDDALMLNNFANLLLKLGDPGAQAAAERALKVAPNNPGYADTLGWILVKKGDISAGLRYLREARLRSPDDAEIRFHLAYALSKVGRMAEAREELLAALGNSGRLQSADEASRLKKELGL